MLVPLGELQIIGSITILFHKEVIIDYFDRKVMDWNVQLVDTGEDTDTGGRIAKCQHLVGDTFMATYVDGLSDVPLDKLIKFHII